MPTNLYLYNSVIMMIKVVLFLLLFVDYIIFLPLICTILQLHLEKKDYKSCYYIFNALYISAGRLPNVVIWQF